GAGVDAEIERPGLQPPRRGQTLPGTAVSERSVDIRHRLNHRWHVREADGVAEMLVVEAERQALRAAKGVRHRHAQAPHVHLAVAEYAQRPHRGDVARGVYESKARANAISECVHAVDGVQYADLTRLLRRPGVLSGERVELAPQVVVAE